MTADSVPSAPEPELTEEQLITIHLAEQAFERMCQERHEFGRTKYGKLTFLEMPTLAMALEEIADMANYMRYTFIRVVLLQQALEEIREQSLAGKEGFFTMEQITGAMRKI
jgi:hypothetical protein